MNRRNFLNTMTSGTALLGLSGMVVGASKPAFEFSHHTSSGVKLEDDIAGDLRFSTEEYRRRYRAIRAEMDKQNIDCLVVSGNREWAEGELANLRYIGAGIDWEPTYVIFPREGLPIVPLKTDAMAPPFMSPSPLEFEHVPAYVRSGTTNSADAAPAIAKQLKKMGLSKGRIGLVSPRIVPAEVVLAIQSELPNAAFVDAERLMLELRYQKSPEEIKFLRRSAYIADVGIAAMVAATQAGASDWDLYYAMDQACAEAGCPKGGMHLLNSGPWKGKKSFIFFDPSSARKIQKGDVIIPEVTSNYQGYYTQLTIPVVVGDAGRSFQDDLELCDKVYSHMMDQFRPGKTVLELDNYCKEFTLEASSGAVETFFAFQAGEHETTFWHDDIRLQPSNLAYNQPFFHSTKGGKPYHVYGDAVICQNGEPLKLHQTPMAPVYL